MKTLIKVSNIVKKVNGELIYNKEIQNLKQRST